MKKIVLLSLLVLASCKNQSEEVKVDQITVNNSSDTIALTDTLVDANIEKIEDIDAVAKPETTLASINSKYASFGTKMTSDKALSKAEMLKKYKNLKAGDTIAVQFKSVIKEVCKKKGCWMSME